MSSHGFMKSCSKRHKEKLGYWCQLFKLNRWHKHTHPAVETIRLWDTDLRTCESRHAHCNYPALAVSHGEILWETALSFCEPQQRFYLTRGHHKQFRSQTNLNTHWRAFFQSNKKISKTNKIYWPYTVLSLIQGWKMNLISLWPHSECIPCISHLLWIQIFNFSMRVTG